MALQLGALREALIDAGASPEKADKAAEELAAYEIRFDGVERRLDNLKVLEQSIKTLEQSTKTDLKVLEQSLKIWTGGVAAAAVSALFAALHYWPPHS